MTSRQTKHQPTKHATVETRSHVTAFALAFALALVLIAATFAAHFPATQAGYIWDDDCLLYQNPDMLGPDGLFRIWFRNRTPDYWPLTATTFWLEWQIWGDTPTPYHVTNITLHALAAVVLWRILKRLNFSDLGALLGGLLFAVHPVTVATAAWISERKNSLSMVLCLLSILSFLRFTDLGRRRWYAMALLAAVAALLAKTSVVALPIILLLLCWWRHNTVARRDLLRTAPFFLLSLALGLVTLWMQHDHAVDGVVVRPEGLASRIASVGWVFWFYLYKLLVPIDLAMIYPRWNIDGGRLLSFVPLALMIACLLILWYYRKGWSKGPLAALGAFVIILAPVLGLLDMTYARLSLAADHLQYPGMPGIMALAGGSMAAALTWVRRRGMRAFAVGIVTMCVAIVLTLAVLTWRQARVYKNEDTLWTHTLRLNNRCWVAYNNRGNAYGMKGDIQQAIWNYSKAIELKPEYTQPYNNRAAAFFGLRQYDKAWADVKKCQQLGGTLSPGFLQDLAKKSGKTE